MPGLPPQGLSIPFYLQTKIKKHYWQSPTFQWNLYPHFNDLFLDVYLMLLDYRGRPELLWIPDQGSSLDMAIAQNTFNP